MLDGDLIFGSANARNTRAVINGRFLAKPIGGVPRVGVELLRALSAELAQNDNGLGLRVATPPSVDLCRLGAEHAGRRTLGFSGRLGEQLAMPVLYRGATVISFCNATPMLAAHSIVWIHDAHVFDAPDTYPLAYRLWHKAMLTVAKVRRFDIVTVSEYARSRLVHYGVNPDLIRVVYNGGDHILREAEDASLLRDVGLRDVPYVLLVGSPARHKNIPFALRALLARRDELRIAVLGLAQSGLYRDGGALTRDKRVVVLPLVTDAQLRALYRSSRAVVAPSLCEGFGLYAAEAMFADAGPLVLSDRAALPEVGGEAALYFDPSNEASLRTAISAALDLSTAERLRAAARKQREKFRWRRAARTLIEHYLR